MKVSEIIKMCSDIANLEIPRNCFENNDDGSALQEVKVTKLIASCNAVLQQLYCDCAVELARTQVVCKDNFIDVSALPFNRVISLCDNFGSSVKYRYTKGGLFAEDGIYTLTYAKLPPELSWDDSFDMPLPRITPRCFVYGVLADYFFAEGDYSQSEVWQLRFEETLKKATVKSSTQVMPVRRWL